MKKLFKLAEPQKRGDYLGSIRLTSTDLIGIINEMMQQHPLPEWIKRDDGWYCGDNEAISFAQECMEHHFNLPEFDVWLSGLEASQFEELGIGNLVLKFLMLTRRQEALTCNRRENTLSLRLANLHGLRRQVEAGEKLAEFAFEHARTQISLEKGRKAAAEKKRKEAKERYGYWRQIAADMFKQNPGWGNEQVAAYIQRTQSGKKNDGNSYSRRRIIDKIQGVKSEVLD